MRQVFQRCNIGDLVVEHFQVFEMLQGSQRRDIRNVVDRDDQHPQFRQVIQEINIVRLVVADIQSFQIPAVPDHGEILAAVLGGFVVVQGGKGGIVRADQVLMIPALDDHGPAPLHIRIAGSQPVALLPAHPILPHVYLFQVRQAIQEGFKGVEIRDDGAAQVNVFHILGPALILPGNIRSGQDRTEQEYQQDKPEPSAFQRPIPLFVRLTERIIT